MFTKTIMAAMTAVMVAGFLMSAPAAFARGNGGGEGGGGGSGGGLSSSAPVLVIAHHPRPKRQRRILEPNCGYNLTRADFADVVALGGPVRACQTVMR